MIDDLDIWAPAGVQERLGNFLVLSLLTLVDVSLIIRLGSCKSVVNTVFVYPSSPWERQSLVRGCFCPTKVTSRIALMSSMSVCKTKQKPLT